MARRWREWVDKKSVPPGTFYSLTENLRAAKNRLVTELPLDILEKVVESTPKAHRTLLVATDDTDVDGNVALDAATKGILKSKRNRLRQAFTGDHDERMRRIRLLDEILACTERVLNPAAHAGATPLYEKEVQDALKLIKDLEVSLSP
ncbi:hypothetical protein [Mesorhizobium sp.]|nr:hypothetical protein [Mesorhizobium sp.]RWB98879.1 MAG: hypothetical protein EOQ56_19290 [Mesorhizobium sp.]RWO34617.1 MAG: hypothetical protein EOS08_05300 [Mesorhizobium sp.]RWP57975.1 MAG: hypothetical protein EOR07_30245 [Mesorhizobium sp.]RWQ13631.1 MAG: hypothetical protein EOR92_29080 [Mesorhizobium sp.]RWQ30854.1 MAG: hypothetical protein EOS19_06465 [Mesorhizobium sp.]